MSYQLADGREVTARYDDVVSFFEKHCIAGREIADVRAAELNYLIQTLDEIENVMERSTECGIDTDDSICFVFKDGDSMEMQFCGDGPILLGFNTADLKSYPTYEGQFYRLSTVFFRAIGAEIVRIEAERHLHRMLFPSFRGIDLSQEEEVVTEIKLYLGDGSYLTASGWLDFFRLEHHLPDGRNSKVEYKKLLSDLNTETLIDIFGTERAPMIQAELAEDVGE